MRVLITGGGTGGHLYPALAVADLLREKDPAGKILFVGTRTGLEGRVVPARGYPFREIAAVKWPRGISLRMVSFLISLGKGYRQGLNIIREFRPEVVFATGGYVSVPLVLAAARLKVPIFLHEQNSVPGLANKFLARWARVVFTTFPPRSRDFPPGKRVVYAGLPVRREILQTERSAGIKYFALDPAHPTLLIMGGSRGARRINETMLEIYQMIGRGQANLPFLQIIHITGRDEYEDFCKQMEQKGIKEDKIGKLVIKPYLEEMEYALASADLIISRAGAATLAEVTARGIPAILIPYPFATGNHQYYNALFLAEKGAAVLIPEKDLTPVSLLEHIEKLVFDPSLRAALGEQARRFGRPEAGEIIARAIMRSGYK